LSEADIDATGTGVAADAAVLERLNCRGIVRYGVGTDTIDPATGRQAYVPFVVVGAERESFIEFNLSAVIPALTLDRLGAAVSKNPYGLVTAETSGVRRA